MWKWLSGKLGEPAQDRADWAIENKIERIGRPFLLMLLVGTVKIFNLALILWGALGMRGAILNGVIGSSTLHTILFTASSGYLLVSLRTVHQEWRWVVEVFGQVYAVLRPGGPFGGLFWLPRGLVRQKARIPMWVARLAMWPNGIKIDLPDGTAAEPKDAEVWAGGIDEDWAILISTYKIDRGNWQGAVTQQADTTIRSYLNTLFVRDLIEYQMGGFDIVAVMERTEKPVVYEQKAEEAEEAEEGKERVVISAKEAIQKAKDNVKSRTGRELVSVYVSDYGLPTEVIAARRRARVDAPLAEEAAIYQARRMATEIGVQHNTIVGKLREELGISRKDAQAIAQQYVTYFKGADTKTLIDWRSSGGEGTLINIAAQIARAIGKVTGGKGETERQKEIEETSEESS